MDGSSGGFGSMFCPSFWAEQCVADKRLRTTIAVSVRNTFFRFIVCFSCQAQKNIGLVVIALNWPIALTPEVQQLENRYNLRNSTLVQL
jgi:hypothetical protein